MISSFRILLLAFVVAGGAIYGGAMQTNVFSPRAEEVPFAYQIGKTRTWPLLIRSLGLTEQIKLKLTKGGRVLAESIADTVESAGLRAKVTRAGYLEAAAERGCEIDEVALEISVEHADGVVENQVIMLRPAPTTKPITYYADFGDDLINIFGAGVAGSDVSSLHHQLREGGSGGRVWLRRDAAGVAQYSKDGLDQYFRRLQNQGINRLVLWMFPFPFVSDASAYGQSDWDLYQRHARAILIDSNLTALMAKPVNDKGGIVRWGWLRDLMAFRLDPNIHQALSQSALEHGISLGVSYRPFEQAGAKYYQLPVFDESGEFLWFFQPLSSPAVNFRAAHMGFLHYREMLANADQGGNGQLTEIHLRPVGDVTEFLARFKATADNLRVVAANFPPIQEDSYVLVRRTDGEFSLRLFGEIRARAMAWRHVVRDPVLRYDSALGVVIANLNIPKEYQYIMLENPSGAAALGLSPEWPVRLLDRQGVELGRNAIYFSFEGEVEERKKTRIAGITAAGDVHAEFFAIEASQTYLRKLGITVKLEAASLVIDRGEIFSREMVDFELATARDTTVAEMRSILKYPAFTEIFVNTRSHTSLAASMADGAEGLKLRSHYIEKKQPYAILGLDLAYAPRSAEHDPAVRSRAAPGGARAEITQFQPGEWSGICQSNEFPYVWRWARNTGVAAGVRALLSDFQAAFPQTRLRVVLPEGGAAEKSLGGGSPPWIKPAPGYQRSRNNYIRNIGEGLTRLDLTGLRVEPVLLGTGPFVTPVELDAYLSATLQDLADNRSSMFRGAKAIMYEGQWTLKDEAGKKAREQVMRRFLDSEEDINEVVVYEAADWAYRLPWNGFDFLQDRSRQ